MPVWNADGTTNDQVGLVLDTNGKLGARFDYRGRRRLNADVAPTVAAGTAAGTSPTVTVTGTDECGVVSVTAGTSPGTGTLATITFSDAYATTPALALVTENDSAATQLGVWCMVSTTALTIKCRTAGTGAAVYLINYVVVGGA